MQKLIWQNADGEEINLTGGNYGITAWEGFSNTSLNIQSQQVPFQDGGVFLDALLEQRELSVTLAIYDGNNLETRYRLRRELIHILNPKLGEGYLIYTNDFTSKRIKCVPQIPLFETHNSNDSGTPKASLAWTACEPYWEDLNETIVDLTVGLQSQIVNDGDVKTGVNIDIITSNITNPQIINLTENKLIRLKGTFYEGININTENGTKQIKKDEISFYYANESKSLSFIDFVETFGVFMSVGTDGCIRTSLNGKFWEFVKTNIGQEFSLYSFIYFYKTNEIIICGEYQYNNKGYILKSKDLHKWEAKKVAEKKIKSICCSNNIIVAVGINGTVVTSQDGQNWTETNVGNFLLSKVIYSEGLNLFVAVGDNGAIITSQDGVSWATRASGQSYNINSICSSDNLLVAVYLNSLLISQDGVNWTQKSLESIVGNYFSFRNIIYCKQMSLFVGVGGELSTGSVVVSQDGETWTYYRTTLPIFRSIAFSISQNIFLSVNSTNIQNYYFGESTNGTDWEIASRELSYDLRTIFYSKAKDMYLVGGNGIAKSDDGRKWKTVSYPENTNGIIGKIIYSERLNLFVAVGTDIGFEYGRIWRSNDGENWENPIEILEILTSVAYSESLGIFVAVGYGYSSGNGCIYTSVDGVNWEKNVFSIIAFNSIVYSEELNLFIAVGLSLSDNIFISNDGLNWSTSRLNADSLIIFFIEEEKLILISARSDHEFNPEGLEGIFTTKNGTTWDKIGNEYISNIAYSKSLALYLSVGSTNKISSNLKKWININTVSTTSSAIFSKKNNSFITVGSKGVILLSEINISDNLISYLSEDSDMTLSLEVGVNNVVYSAGSGESSIRIKYRQKYLGV